MKMWVKLMDLSAEYNPRYRLRANAEEVQRALFADFIVRDDAFLMVCEVDRRLISFANGFLTRPAKTFAQSTIGVIENLFVIKPWRRRGIGREMAARSASLLSHLGAVELHVNVIPKNTDSLKFWRALDYQVQRVAMFKPASIE